MNLIKNPGAYNPPKIVGFRKGTLIKAQGSVIRFPHQQPGDFWTWTPMPNPEPGTNETNQHSWFRV